MYKTILIPTDGSDLSAETALAGVEFARQNRAEVIGIFVAPVFRHPVYVDMTASGYPSQAEYQESLRKEAEACLGTIQKAAEAAGVKFSGVTVFSDAVAHEIVHAAQEKACDLIFMGSHGRSGWGQAILGSVTNKVLSSCQIPVLVHRLKREPAVQTQKM